MTRQILVAVAWADIIACAALRALPYAALAALGAAAGWLIVKIGGH